MDGTSDVSKTKYEAVVILYCKKDDFAKQMQSCTGYLAVSNPYKADTTGLVHCLGDVLKNSSQIQNVCDCSKVLEVKPVLIEGGTDVASVNIAQHKSIRSKLQEYLPWLYWSWC